MNTKQSIGIFSAVQCFLFLAMTCFSAEPNASEVKTLTPKIEVQSVFPNPPTVRPVIDRTVLLKDSPFFWDNPAGERATKAPYQAAPNGFTKHNGTSTGLDGSRHHHLLVFENNQISVGDRPMAKILLTAFSSMYGNHDTFPITGVGMVEALPKGTATIGLGSIRYAVEAGGRTVWLDRFPEIQVTYQAGLARWECSDTTLGIALNVEIRPNIRARGFVTRCIVKQAPAGAKLHAFFGGLGYYADASTTGSNVVTMQGKAVKVTSPELPRAMAFFGLDAPQAVSALAPDNVFDIQNTAIEPAYDASAKVERSCARLTAPLTTGQTITGIAVWGADGYDRAKADEVKQRLISDALAQPYYDKVWNTWFENFIGKQLEPEKKFAQLMADPGKAWREAESFWLDRAARWGIVTPDAALNAAGNWAGQTMEYFRQPPGYMLGYVSWQGYGHITTGWYPLLTMGDDEQFALLLGTFAGTRLGTVKDYMDKEKTKQNKHEIPWVFLNLDTTLSEPLNAPFIDHVWNYYLWTGDKGWLEALWPAVRDAIEGEMTNRDPDGDGLYHGFYEFWDCDAEQRGPKAAGETGWMIAGLRGASKMANALGHTDEAEKYAAAAEKSEKAWQAQLWYPEIGQAGARTADDQRYERASIHEDFIPALRGVMSEKQMAQAFRRLQHLYSQTSSYGTQMMFKNDVWPILWSQHYMPPGDISMTYMAAAKCGLSDEYYPYLQTVAAAASNTFHAGFGLSVGQDGTMDSGEVANSDSQSSFAWSVAQGLFGVGPDDAPGKLLIAPNLPAKWPAASAAFGQVKLSMTQLPGSSASLEVSDGKHRELRIQWPTRYPVRGVTLNGKPVEYQLIPAVNRALIEIKTKADGPVKLEMQFQGEALELTPLPEEAIAGESMKLSVRGGKIAEIDDPQKCLEKSSLAADGASDQITPRGEGFHTFFARIERDGFGYWSPVSFRIGAAWEIETEFEAADPPRTAPIRQLWPKLEGADHKLMVRLRNRQQQPLEGTARLTVPGQSEKNNIKIDAGKTAEIEIAIKPKAWEKLLPGAIAFSVEIGGMKQEGKVYAWPDAKGNGAAAPSAPAPQRLVMLNIDSARNLTEKKMEETPMPLDFGQMDKLLGWYNTTFTMNPLPRRFEPLPGLPFLLGEDSMTTSGASMLVLSHAGTPPLPTRARFDVGRKVERIYALTIFHYYAIKAWSPEAEWILTYDDGSQKVVSWIPPLTVDSMLRPESPWTFAVPLGKSSSPGWTVPTYFLGPIHGQVIDIPADPSRVLESIEARQTSTESYMALLGITLVTPKGGN